MDLTKQNWALILKGNNLLSGFSVTEGDTIKRARKPAFLLFDDALQEPGIPEIELFDDSYITVTELHSSFQSSAVNHCLDLKDVSGSLKSDLIILPVGGGGSGKYRTSNAITDKVEKSSATEELYVAYNFPRVIVNLEPEHLQLTPACRKAIQELEKTKDLAALDSFYSLFGHVFPLTSYLGGRLQCARSVKLVAGSTVIEKTETLKKAASAIFAISKRNNASFNYERENTLQSMSSQTSGAEFMASAWEARGGDTLLSTDPTAWAPTVKPFESWRAVHRTDVRTIIDVISNIEGFEHVPELVKTIIAGDPANKKPETVPMDDPDPARQAGILPILSKVLATSPVQVLPGTAIAALPEDFGGCSGEWTFFQDTEGWIRCTVRRYKEIRVAQQRLAAAKVGTPIAAMFVQDEENIRDHKTKIRVYYITRDDVIGELSWNEVPHQWVTGPLHSMNIKTHPSSELWLQRTSYKGCFLWYQRPDLRIGQYWCESLHYAYSYLDWLPLEPANVLPEAAAGTAIAWQETWPEITLGDEDFKEVRFVMQNAAGQLCSVSTSQPSRRINMSSKRIDTVLPRWVGQSHGYKPELHKHLPIDVPMKFALEGEFFIFVDGRVQRLAYVSPKAKEPKEGTRLGVKCRPSFRECRGYIRIAYQDSHGDLQQLGCLKGYNDLKLENALLDENVESVPEMAEMFNTW